MRHNGARLRDGHLVVCVVRSEIAERASNCFLQLRTAELQLSHQRLNGARCYYGPLVGFVACSEVAQRGSCPCPRPLVALMNMLHELLDGLRVEIDQMRLARVGLVGIIEDLHPVHPRVLDVLLQLHGTEHRMARSCMATLTRMVKVQGGRSRRGGGHAHSVCR